MTTEAELGDARAVTASCLVELAPPLYRVMHETLRNGASAMSYRQYRLLLRISQGHSYVTDLSRLMDLSMSTLSQSIDGLVRKGLIRRETQESDRRRVCLAPTEDGRDALRLAGAQLDSIVEIVTSVMERLEVSVEESERIADILEHLIPMVRRERKRSWPSGGPD